MQGSKCYQPRIFYQVSLEQLVPEDHLVRQLAKVLDLGWVRQATCACYSYTGRPSIDPVVIAKMFVLGFLYNIGSERQLMRDIRVNLAYRWYLGHDLDEAIPDHSVLSKARRRLGTEFFEQIFSFVLAGCREAGLVDGSNLLIDSTGMAANASASSITALRYTPEQYWQQLEATSEDNNNEDGNTLGQDRPRDERLRDCKRSSTDPDATLFRRPGGSVLGYKAHVGADAESGVITAVSVTTGSVDDTSAVPQIRGQCIGTNASARVVTRYDTPYVERDRQACVSFRGRRLLRLRQTCIEGLFGQAKSLHGMARARWLNILRKLHAAFEPQAFYLEFDGGSSLM
jgi:transposase